MGLAKLGINKSHMCHFLTIGVPGKTVPEVPNEFRHNIQADGWNKSSNLLLPVSKVSFSEVPNAPNKDSG